MSGIYGIYRYDGAPVDPRWMERMQSAMAYYGPHGQGSKVEGSLGLGHLLLKINPESAFEKQPIRAERGLVVSTARLDNRPELLDAFDISPSEAHRTSDGNLVSLAFDRWGEDLSSHLQGDWSLAAWNARERRLLLAMNALGSASLYYYEGKGFVAFASSLKALLAIPGVVREADSLVLAELLVSWNHDAERTAYKGFRRLLWAHAMTIAPDGQTRIARHWSWEGRDLLAYRRDEEYEEAFLEHYTRAVQNCLRTPGPLAAALSAGRDSGSVVAMAAPLLAAQGRTLTAYTSVPLFPPDGATNLQMGNEWDLAHETATMAGSNVQHVPIDAKGYSVIQGIEYFIDLYDAPGHAAMNQYWFRAVMEAATGNGAGAMLAGDMGNATVSWEGNGSAVLALMQGYPATASRLFLRAEPNPWLTLKRQVLKPLLLPGLQALRRLKSPPSKSWQAYSALNIQKASELDLDGRMRAARHDPTFSTSPLQDMREFFYSDECGIGAGCGAAIQAWHSIPYLDPTANLSLTEFLLRVPDDQFYRKGTNTFLMKRALKNRLPGPVLMRKRGGLQSADVGHRILAELPAFRECLSSLDSLPEAGEILNMPLLHRCLDDLVAKVDPLSTANAGQILLRGMGAGLFLRRVADSRS